MRYSAHDGQRSYPVNSSNVTQLRAAAAALPAREASGFCRLDALVAQPDVCGRVRVKSAPNNVAALSRHIRRRCAQLQRHCVVILPSRREDPWRQLAQRMQLQERAMDSSRHPQLVAVHEPAVDIVSDIIASMHGGVLVVASSLPPNSWARELVEELRHRTREGAPLLLIELWSGLASTEISTISAPQAHSPSMDALTSTVGSATDATGNGFGNGPASRPAHGSAPVVDERLVCGELGQAELRSWWDAVVLHPEVPDGQRSLGQLDDWWQRAQRLPAVDDAPTDALSQSAQALLLRLHYLGVPLSASQIERSLLGAEFVDNEATQGRATQGRVAQDRVAQDRVAQDRVAQDRAAERRAIDELVAAEALVADGGALPMWRVSADIGWRLDERLASLRVTEDGSLIEHLGRASLRSLVDVLTQQRKDTVTSAPLTPWTAMRAAEILGALGDGDAAEQWAEYALTQAADRAVRQDLWARYLSVLSQFHGSDVLVRLLRAAERALTLGDGERAEELTRRAVALDNKRFDVLFAHGRASQLRGDLTAAALSTKRALSTARDDDDRARAAALMAQVRLVAGDEVQARTYAEQAAELATVVRTRLDGRNVLGKLLLAGDDWSAAEEHFAQDAYDAAIASEHEAELRARLNRAVAVMSLGRHDQARRLLEQVLQAGEQRKQPKAVAFALSNLASVAILQHRFADALSLSERAITIRTHLGVRHGLVQPITNLAELRLMLGMVDEAEASLRFGLKSCGSNLPATLFAYFAKTMAQVHLARGETSKAQQSLTSALSACAITGDVALPGKCHRIAAQIALADGDVARARATLKRSEGCRHTGFGQAELVVIDAQIRRAAGEDYLAAAEKALSLGHQNANVEATLSACVLLAQACQTQGDTASAQLHIEHATQVRDQVVAGLPGSLRERYLGRAEMRQLAEVERVIGRGDTARGDIGCGPAGHSATPARQKRVRRGAVEQALMVGSSPAMVALRRSVDRLAVTDATVMVHGETGTGKELVAEAIHAASDRAEGPLIKVNCAALVETLLLSELFGHERGAFTGAQTRRRGRFEMADGGTLFLDEIGDISPRTQVALLRVLQDGVFERVGGGAQLNCDVRVIAATHRDLKALVAEGSFREDLYYRLCGMVVEVPPLRDRKGDIAELSQALMVRMRHHRSRKPPALGRDALTLLSNHDWPGNVRELQNALRAASVFAAGNTIAAVDFSENVAGLANVSSSVRSLRPAPRQTRRPSDSGQMAYAEIKAGTCLAEMKRKLEQQCISQALLETSGNITRAAELLGMKRPRLSQLVKKYELATVVEEAKS